MGKLRASNYLKNNKKRAAILVISFGLYFALLYGVRFFLNPMFYTDEAVFLENSDRMQHVYVNRGDQLHMNLDLWDDPNATEEDLIKELNYGVGEFAKELRKDQRIDYVIQCYTYGINIPTIVSTSYYSVPMVTKEEVKILCDYMGAELIEGVYPEHEGDILMDERMAKSRKLKVGDNIYDSSTRVCGLVTCKGYFAVGLAHDDTYVRRDLFFLDKGTVPDLAAFFDEYGWEATTKDSSELRIHTDYVNSKALVEKSKKEFEQPLTIMVFVITLVMGITLYIVYQLHVKDRYEEWCLYRSLGYSQREVFTLALREYGICVLLGIIFGLIGLAIVFLIGGNMMYNQGITFRYWIPETLTQLVGIFVLLTGVLQIPVFIAMRHITTIDEIEDDM